MKRTTERERTTERSQRRASRESGRIAPVLALFLLLLIALPAGCLIARSFDKTAPQVAIETDAKAIGNRPVRIVVEAREPKHGIRDLRAVFVQGTTQVPLGEATYPKNPLWRLWGRKIEPSARLELDVSRERIPELKEGEAVIRAEATNDSGRGFGKGSTTVTELVLPVSFTPPRIEILSSQHYVNQGGSECVVYRVSETAVASGVRIGDYYFRGYQGPGPGEGARFAIFAYPHDVPPGVTPQVVASDIAGNEAKVAFPYKLFPRTVRRATIELTDPFLQHVVPSILSQTPVVKSQGDLLKDFLEINGRLRRANAEQLVAISSQSAPTRLWRQPFVQLGSSKVEASFADHRSYRYKGQVVDRQDHLGFDLAVSANHPVDASNDGVVVVAEWFGIYGNTVILDHGCGLMTLYAHLSSIDVKPQQKVTRGQVIGRSGATGLAGGDHLHFSVLLQGIPVDPVEWWDGHWIHDRIEAKLGPGPATGAGGP